MCPPKRPTIAAAPPPSSQAAPDTLQIGDRQDPDKPKGRDQVRTAPATGSLQIAGTGSGLQI